MTIGRHPVEENRNDDIITRISADKVTLLKSEVIANCKKEKLGRP